MSHVAACAFVMDQVSCSFVCQAMLPTLSEHPCRKKRDFVAFGWSSRKVQRRFACGTRTSPHASFLFPSLLFSCARVQHAPSHQFLRAVCWWRAIAPHSQWSEAASEKDAILFNLAVGFLVGVCSCVTIGWAQRGSSLEFVLSAKQFRSQPESLRSDSRCELEFGIERSGSTGAKAVATLPRCARFGSDSARRGSAGDSRGRRREWRRTGGVVCSFDGQLKPSSQVS